MRFFLKKIYNNTEEFKMSEIKTAWHWWWGWNPEKIENWLEEMEQDGWNLIKVDFNYLRFKFEKGEYRKIRYCVDYQNRVDDNYFGILKEDGWELVGDRSIPWYMWRKSYDNERPNIYTDAKSLIERNNRQLMTVGILLPFEIVVINSLLKNGSSTTWVLALFFMIIVFMGYVTLQLYRYNKKLEKSEMKF